MGNEKGKEIDKWGTILDYVSVYLNTNAIRTASTVCVHRLPQPGNQRAVGCNEKAPVKIMKR